MNGINWTRDRDSYGRVTYALRNGDSRTVGVVIKHPLRSAGEAGAYWYCRWDLPTEAPASEKVVEFRDLPSAKAALLRATA